MHHPSYRLLPLLAALLALGLAAAPAHALSVRVGGSTLHVTAAAGETNRLTVGVSGASYVVTEAGPLVAVAARDLPCSGTGATTTCPTSGISSIVVDAGDGADTITIAPEVGIAARITDGAGDDTVTGGRMADTFVGSPGDDVLAGGAGDDSFGDAGGAGADRVDGGDGRDTADYRGRSAPLVVTLDDAAGDGAAGEGDDVRSTVENVEGGSGADRIVGSDAANVLRGNNGDDVFDGRGAADTLAGGGGQDGADYRSRTARVVVSADGVANDGAAGEADNVGTDVDDLYGGAGDDDLTGNTWSGTLDGGAGSDTVRGGAGDDTLVGGTGADRLEGGDGIDLLDGGSGDDDLLGSSHDDTLDGGTGADDLDGGAGVDLLDYRTRTAAITVDLDAGTTGEPGEGDRMWGIQGALGGRGADRLRGDENDNRFDGGAGDDVLDGRDGADRLAGGAGWDVADYGARRSGLAVDTDDRADDGQSGEGDDVRRDVEELVGGSAGDRLDGGDGPNVLRGGGGDDQLRGHGGDDRLEGADGHDQAWGGAGHDTLPGGAGNDKLYGEDGWDTVDGADGADQVEGGEGDDRLIGGSSADKLYAHAGNDVLDGGSGDDVLDAHAGDDHLAAGSGADRLAGHDGNDALSGADGDDQLWGGAGNDALDAASGADKAYGEDGDDVVDGGPGSDGALEGGRGNDRVLGGADHDKLVGHDGNDLLDAGDGNDQLYGQAGVDTLSAGAGNDKAYGEDGDDVVDGAGGDDAVEGGRGNDALTAGDGNDRLSGHDGDDALDAGTGDDQLDGHDGNDRLAGGDGNDRVNGQDGDDRFDGGEGDDALSGGGDADVLVGGGGADELKGDDGEDTVDYSARTAPLRLTNDDKADDGEAGERDDVAGSVDHAIGGAGRDLIRFRTDWPHRLYGEGGNDTLDGGGKDDELAGGAGDDELIGRGGRDRFDGGAGKDRLSGADNLAETLRCGAGKDLAVKDRSDKAVSCETLRRGKPSGGSTPAGPDTSDVVPVPSSPGRRTGVRRLSKGGGITSIPGSPGERIDRRLLKDIAYLKSKYKIAITDGFAMSGHAAGGEHPRGLAIDVVPGPGGSWSHIDRLAKWAEPRQNRPRAPFRWVGYNGDSGHGRGHHLHLSWKHAQVKAGGRPAAWVEVFSFKRNRPVRRVRDLVPLARRSNFRMGGKPSVRSGVRAVSRCRGAAQLVPAWKAAARAFRLRWTVLAAITQVESGLGCNMGPSSAGAIGWTQFMPATWKIWGMDGDGDGKSSPYNSVDAIFSTARYLRASGAPRSYRKALWHYNHADWYVNLVLKTERRFR